MLQSRITMFSICWIKISVPHTLQSFTFFLVRMSNTSSCRIESCSKYLSKSCWWRMLEQCFKLDSMRYLSGGNCVWQSLEHYLFELNWNVQVRTNHSDFLLMYGFAQAKCATRLSNYFLSLNFQQFAFLFVGFNQSLCNSAHICLIGAENTQTWSPRIALHNSRMIWKNIRKYLRRFPAWCKTVRIVGSEFITFALMIMQLCSVNNASFSFNFSHCILFIFFHFSIYFGIFYSILNIFFFSVFSIIFSLIFLSVSFFSSPFFSLPFVSILKTKLNWTHTWRTKLNWRT